MKKENNPSTELQYILNELESLKLQQKEILTLKEACAYTGLKPSYMYKLTSKKKIEHHKPLNKCIYFEKSVLDSFLTQNRITPSFPAPSPSSNIDEDFIQKKSDEIIKKLLG